MATYFSVILVVVSALTGLVWLVYSLFFAPKAVTVSASTPGGSSDAVAKVLSVDAEMPAAVDFCKQMFPIFFWCDDIQVIYL